ncbi:putative uncharacterized protein [Sutterella sp. CAG:397]|nr:putative uncharacterized protein [Sutterella sp. CAG:397]
MAIAVCPSLKVVKSCAIATGIAVFLGMTFSTSPPMVSRPRDNGVTSRSNQSSPSATLPASLLACIAAPTATTWSGSMLQSGAFPKYASTALRTQGMRVAPPTSTTPLISAALFLASFKTFPTASVVFCTSGKTMSSKAARVSVFSIVRPSESSSFKTTASVSVSASRAFFATSVSLRLSLGVRIPSP